MKARMFLLICGGLIASVVFVGATGYGQRQVPQRTKWEYKMVNTVNNDKDLNDLGAEGWELTGVSDEPGRLYFKRPKIDALK